MFGGIAFCRSFSDWARKFMVSNWVVHVSAVHILLAAEPSKRYVANSSYFIE